LTASVQNPADVVNLALGMIGYPLRIGSLYDGSAAAKAALTCYAETRDEVLRSKDWPFALRQVAGTTGPSTVSGWAYSWLYPADCIRLRSIAPATIPSPDFDPQAVLWTLYNDQTQSPPQKVILTQITPVSLNYVGQITDMTTWEPLFVNAVAQALGQKLAAMLVRQAPEGVDAATAVAVASMADDAQSPDDAMPQLEAPKRQRQPQRQQEGGNQ
jgi:hypothetical protein